jgi:hypothetical protein
LLYAGRLKLSNSWDIKSKNISIGFLNYNCLILILNIKLTEDFIRIRQILINLLSWFYKIPRFDFFNMIIINYDSLFLLKVKAGDCLVFLD